ncbi:MAG TPA: hypothetical protein VGM88_35290 [Kofleriaceae bacterium]|jgi:hypothetical protein
MGYAELQIDESLFLKMIGTLASLTPIPSPTLPFLPAKQLVRSIGIEVGTAVFDTPAGLTVAPGALLMKQPVVINHVSIDELATDAKAPGTDLEATFWLAVTMTPTTIGIAVVRIDVGTTTHDQSPPLAFGTQALPLPDLGGATLNVTGTGFVHDAALSLVVGRLAVDTLSAQLLLSTPVVDHRPSGDAWALFLAADVLVTAVVGEVATGIAGNLSDTLQLETPASGQWTKDDNGWGLSIVVGLLAVDACPAAIGDDVDMSIDLDIRAQFTSDLANQVIDMRLHMSHDASDWDSFRCILQNIGSALLISFAGPALVHLDVLYGIIYPFAIPFQVNSGAAAQVAKASLPGITKLATPDDGDDATYTTQLPLLTLLTAATDNVSIDANGITMGGPSLFLAAAEHVMGLTPSPITGDWYSSFSCNTDQWDATYVPDPVRVSDSVQVGSTVLATPPVVMFSTSEVRPAAAWSLAIESGLDGTATLTEDGDPVQGATAMVFIHSSAGLARIDLVPVAKPPAAPTGLQLEQMKIGCQKASGSSWWPGGFNPQWSVDPGPEGELAGWLRQWLIQVPILATGSTLTVNTVGAGIAQTSTLVGRGALASIDLIGNVEQTIHVAIGGAAPMTGILSQRQLLPVTTTALPATVLALARAGDGMVAALTEQNITIFAGQTGGVLARRSSYGATRLQADPAGLIAWGPSGAYRVTGTARGTITTREVTAVQRDATTRALVLHGADGELRLDGSVARRTDLVQIRPVAPAAPLVHSLVLGRGIVAVGMGSTVVFARPGKQVRDVAVTSVRPAR